MGRFWENNEIHNEEDGEFQQKMTKWNQNLAELECEEAIIKDKERFGRVRNTLMKALRTKYGQEIADRTLNRINKRIQEGNSNSRTRCNQDNGSIY